MQKKKEILPDYTEEEICRIYRNQEDRAVGVKNLVQLTGWSYIKIEEILTKHGYNIVPYTKKNLTGGRPTRIVDEVALTLYNNGATDSEIARYFDTVPSSASKWRKTKELKANYTKNKERTHAIIREGLKAGHGVTKIAKRCGLAEATVKRYIKDNNLEGTNVQDNK